MGWRDLQEPSSGLTEAEKKASKKKAMPPEPAASTPKPKPKPKPKDTDATPQAVLDDVMAKGGRVKKMAKGGITRGDGCAQRGKTKGRMV
jgi:hypothetical protein